MSFITAEVHDELFQGWLKETKNNFHLMLETMIRVAEEIKKDVQTNTSPVRTGKLSRSFREFVLTDNSKMKVVEIQMRALNERTGFDYAEVKHRGYHTSKNGLRVSYGYNRAIIDTGFYNYRIDWERNYQKRSSDVHNLHRGHDQYMYWSIIHTEQSAYEMIETDYLSMFQGGFIV